MVSPRKDNRDRWGNSYNFGEKKILDGSLVKHDNQDSTCGRWHNLINKSTEDFTYIKTK